MSSEHCAGLQFCIIYRSRNNSNVDRDETIAMLAGLVMSAGKGHKVDLNNPDLAICVEIIKVNVKQLLDEVEHDIVNYQNRGLCYLPKPKAEADNTDTRF